MKLWLKPNGNSHVISFGGDRWEMVDVCDERETVFGSFNVDALSVLTSAPESERELYELLWEKGQDVVVDVTIVKE